MESTQFHCTICEIDVLGITNYSRHVESLEHANKIHLKNLGNITDEDKVCCSSNTGSMKRVFNGDTKIKESGDVGRKYSSLKCELCQKQFTGYEPYQQHLESAGHRKKLGMLPDPNHSILNIRCTLCDKDYSGPYEQHIITNIHKKGIFEKELNQKENPYVSLAYQYKEGNNSDGQLKNNQDAVLRSSSQSGALRDNSILNNIERFSCDICDKCFSGRIPYDQHMSSNVHMKKVRDRGILNKVQNKTCASELVITSMDKPSALPLGTYYCDVCDKNCSGPVPFDQHLNSLQHKKKVQDKKMFGKLLTAGSNDQVDSTSDYRSSPVCSSFSTNGTGKIPDTVDNFNNSELPYCNQKGLLLICDICDKSFNGSVPYQQHIDSAAHQKKKLQKSNMANGENKNIANNGFSITSSPNNGNFDPAYYCKMCDKHCSGSVPFNQHKMSDAHCKKERLVEIEKRMKELDSTPAMVTKPASIDSIENDLLGQAENESNIMSPRVHQAESDLIMGDVLKDLNFVTPETLNVTTFKVDEDIVFGGTLR